MTIIIRNLKPDDYEPIIMVVNKWWNGRQMSQMLPKLFLLTLIKPVLFLKKRKNNWIFNRFFIPN